jgi:hypothetical protein
MTRPKLVVGKRAALPRVVVLTMVQYMPIKMLLKGEIS